MFQPSIPSLLLQKRSSVFVMLQKCHESFKTLLHKELSAGVLKKKCFENMPQIYRRTPMPKCDFNKFAKQLCWNHTSAIVPSCNLLQIFRTHFPENTSGGCRALWSIVKTFLPLSFSMLNIFYESLGTNLINPFIPSVVVKLRPPRFTSKDLIRPIEVFVKRFGVLRSDARQNKTPNFPTKWTFLPPDTQTYVCVSEGKKCLFFRKIGRALFSWNTHIDIRLLIYYRRKSGLTSIDSTYVIDSFWGGAWCSFAAVFQDHL